MSEITGTPIGTADTDHLSSEDTGRNNRTTPTHQPRTQTPTQTPTGRLGNLASRAPTTDTGGGIRRTASLPLSSQATSSASATTATHQGAQLSADLLTASLLSDADHPAVQMLASEFRDLMGLSSATNLDEQTRNVGAALHATSSALSGLSRLEQPLTSRMSEVAEFAHDPAVQAAEANFSDKKRIADELNNAAGTKASEAGDLRAAATEAGKEADTASKKRADAEREAGAAHQAAEQANAKATDAQRKADAARAEADGADRKAKAAEQDADTALKRADQAGEAADKAHTTAEGKSDRAEQQAQVAKEAAAAATRLAGAADTAAQTAQASREAATQARKAADVVPGAEGESLRAKATALEQQADRDEAAAKEAEGKARTADNEATKADESARRLHDEATDAHGAAASAREEADGLRATADELRNSAKDLRVSANELRGDAALKQDAAEKLQAEADKLGGIAREAGKKAAAAQNDEKAALAKFQEADKKAEQAEGQAQQLRAQANAANDALEKAGAKLGEAVEAAKAKAAEEAAKQKDKQKAADTEGAETERGEGSGTNNRATDTDQRRSSEIQVVGDDSHEPPLSRSPSVDGRPATPEEVEQHSKIANWAANAGKVFGQHFVSVAISTALREVAGGTVQYLVDTTNPSDEKKTAAACVLYGSLMVAQAASMLQDEREGVATGLSRTGGAGQLAILAGSLATGLATGSLNQLLPSFVKTFVYSSGRDLANTVFPLTTDPKITANPAFVQLANTLLYGTNQALVNAWQTFAGTSGAGYVDALRHNGTDPNTGKPETPLPGLGAVTSYVTANYMGEVANMFVETALKSVLEGKPLPDFTLTATAPTLEGIGKTFRDDGILRTGAFLGTYAGTNAINPAIQRSHIGEKGAGWAESTVGSVYLMVMLLFCALATMKKDRTAEGEEGVALPRRDSSAV